LGYPESQVVEIPITDPTQRLDIGEIFHIRGKDGFSIGRKDDLPVMWMIGLAAPQVVKAAREFTSNRAPTSFYVFVLRIPS
jgi:hypothetical protein